MEALILVRKWCSAVLLLALIVGCDAQEQRDTLFSAGREALQRGQLQLSIDKLLEHLNHNPKGRLASRANFLIGKAYLGLGNLDASRKQFEQTIADFQFSEEAHKSKYKLAMLSLIEGKNPDARKRFEELTKNPSGTLVPEATAMLRYLDQPDPAQPAGDNE